MTQTNYAAPAELAARRLPAFAAGAAGLALCGLGFAIDRDQFFRAYLIAYLFWLGVPLGSMALMMVHHMSGGAWGVVIRRIFEASSRTLPLLAVLFLPIVFGMQTLYPWANADLVAHDGALQHKAIYLNTPFFLARAAFYFACWIGLATVFSRWSLAQDGGDRKAARRMERLSGAGLVIYGLTITFAAVDWVMSLDPHWFSTMMGFLFMGSQGLAALAFTVVVAVALSRRAPMRDVFQPAHFHDLGKLMLAFVMLWAYFNFSQFLIIYSGNLAEEVPYYINRLTGGWQYVALVLVVLHFALPFALLLSRDLKRNANRLTAIAILVLVMRVVDLIFLVSPEFNAAGVNLHSINLHGGEHETGGLFFHWLDIAAPIGIGGVWLGYFLMQLAGRPLLPVRDAHLAEALEATGGH
ncbi:MAG: hypothetical protein Q7J25_11520 [Vicinamibacterales bacterium]|nr:hypothetical protein [Vicinamibacterales bacterium]